MSLFAWIYTKLGGTVYPCSAGGKPHVHYGCKNYEIEDCISRHCPHDDVGPLDEDERDDVWICFDCGASVPPRKAVEG